MPWWVGALGYLGSALYVLALLVRPVVRLRLLWVAGGLAFGAYGVLIGAWPVVVANAAIVAVQVLRLRRDVAPRAATDIAAVPIEPHHPFLQDFLAANLAEIKRSQPDFDPDSDAGFIRLITRHGLPAGVLMGRPQGQELDIVLDYVTPRYRDSRQGRWLFGEGRGTFTEAGFRRLVAAPTTYEHQSYLEGLGFTHEGARLVKAL